MKKEAVLNNIDFKELAKSCKRSDDISKLTKEFMKSMIENMLKTEIEEFIEKSESFSKNGYYSKKVRSDSGELELNETYPKFCVCEIITKIFHSSTPNSNFETNI